MISPRSTRPCLVISGSVKICAAIAIVFSSLVPSLELLAISDLWPYLGLGKRLGFVGALDGRFSENIYEKFQALGDFRGLGASKETCCGAAMNIIRQYYLTSACHSIVLHNTFTIDSALNFMS